MYADNCNGTRKQKPCGILASVCDHVPAFDGNCVCNHRQTEETLKGTSYDYYQMGKAIYFRMVVV